MKKKWSPWPNGAAGTAVQKFHVKVNRLKLELAGFLRKAINGEDDDGNNYKKKVVAMEVKWKGPKSGALLVPFQGRPWRQRNYTARRLVSDDDSDRSVEWDDEFERLCSLSPKVDAWNLSFTLLYGSDESSEEIKKSKMRVLGKTSVNLAELASRMESQIETKLPIVLKLPGIATQATLFIYVSFAEVRNSRDLGGIVQNSTTKSDGDGLRKRVDYFRSFRKKSHVEPLSCDSDEPTRFASARVDLSSRAELRCSTTRASTSESQSDPVKKSGLLSWKRRPLSFEPVRKKIDPPLIPNTARVNDHVEVDESSPVGPIQKAVSSKDCWEVKEVISRDGQAKLKTPMFFASFDQRSEMAAGESACTALVTVIAHWLHSNQDLMPSRSEFDSLITQGSSEWQRLCNNEAYMNFFPNRHFDLETVLEADLRPLAVWPDNSFVGFFSPDKFNSLKEAMSFEKIWKEISNDAVAYEPKIYIVSWNDHFFVLKVEADAYYIIDSLGERLYEGCNQAYILKYDDSSIVYAEEKKVESDQEPGSNNQEEKRQEEVICRGKECCREFIKRFLAAIPLGELEEEERKGTVSNLQLHQRLQIEFHYSYSSPSSSTSTFSTPSPFSGEWFTSM